MAPLKDSFKRGDVRLINYLPNYKVDHLNYLKAQMCVLSIIMSDCEQREI